MERPSMTKATTAPLAQDYIAWIEQNFISQEFRQKHVTYAMLYLKNLASNAQEAIQVYEQYLNKEE